MKYLEFEEPVPGCDENGNVLTGNQTVRISVEDAVNYQRYYMMQKYPRVGLHHFTTEELLDEFKVINWATEKKYHV